jgi:hypothetical protein
VRNDAVDSCDTFGLCWGNFQALKHYKHGSSNTVTLSEIGCKDIVYSATSSTRKEWEKKIRKDAESIACFGSSVEFSDSVSPHSGVFWIGGVRQYKRNASCKITKSGSVANVDCDLGYDFIDRFDAPLDIDNSKNDFWDRWEFGNPFYIKDSWSNDSNIKFCKNCNF